ncbi:MAG: hypothetical protein ABIG11_05270 [bacterium]
MKTKIVVGLGVLLIPAFFLLLQQKSSHNRPSDLRDAPNSEGAINQLQNAAGSYAKDMEMAKPAVASPTNKTYPGDNVLQSRIESMLKGMTCLERRVTELSRDARGNLMTDREILEHERKRCYWVGRTASLAGELYDIARDNVELRDRTKKLHEAVLVHQNSCILGAHTNVPPFKEWVSDEAVYEAKNIYTLQRQTLINMFNLNIDVSQCK